MIRPLIHNVNYEEGENGKLLTPCPYDIEPLQRWKPGQPSAIKVGGSICQRCDYFVSIDKINKVVECNYTKGVDHGCKI